MLCLCVPKKTKLRFFHIQNDLYYLSDFIAETWLIIYIGKFVRWSMVSCQFKSVCVNIRINYVSTLLVFLFISFILGSFSQNHLPVYALRYDGYDTIRLVSSANQSINNISAMPCFNNSIGFFLLLLRYHESFNKMGSDGRKLAI